jgi:hypothetical protein
MTDASPEAALSHIAAELRRRNRKFALVGWLGVSIRGEVRFTRGVDLALVVNDDADVEALVRDLAVAGYSVVAIVEHEERGRTRAL